MPLTPRQYGLVPIPQGTSPLQGLSEIMSMGRQLQAYGQESKDIAKQKRVEAALNEGKGDPIAAAKVLEEKHGDFANARLLRDKAQEIRLKTVDQMNQRLDEHKTVFGQGAQMLKEVEARPELYSEMRPRLVELASSLDPRLGAEIPETYEPEKVRGLLQFAQGAATDTVVRQRGLATLKEALAQTKDAVAQEEGFTKSLSDWLSTSGNEMEWNATKEHAATMGIPKTVIDKFGAWDDKARDRAREMALTPDQRETAKRAGIDDKRADDNAKETARHNKIMEGIGRQRESRLNADETGRLTPAAKATAERWKGDQLEQLEREFADRSPTWEDGVRIPPSKPEMTEAQLRSRQLAIENNYRAQIGLTALTALPASWTGGGEPPPAPAPKPAQAAPGGKQAVQSDMVGKTVTLPGGKRVTVKAVYADGTFDGDPAQ